MKPGRISADIEEHGSAASRLGASNARMIIEPLAGTALDCPPRAA